MADLILWRRLDLPGHEFAALAALNDFWELSGSAVFAHDGTPCRLDYFIRCDSRWHTRLATVNGMIGNREIDLYISVDSTQRWYVNDAVCPDINGCIDIDLGFSPSTNLLPIRRLALNTGEQAEVRAAWLPFPSLTFEVLPQLYRRESQDSYRYESANGAFVRQLQVNAAGFVTNYPDLWKAEFA